jgi:ABC-type Fe3+/spermidine/putrescine transport system ATPase subunit
MIRVLLDGLVKRHGRVAAVDGVTLEVRPGELTYVLGPPGAGKTTLARLVAGLEAPDAGEIYLDGRPMTGVPPPGRRVGLVFQDDPLWPLLSVAEHVGYGLKVGRVPRPERSRRVAEVLDLAGIEGLDARHPGELSALQRQRVALARALAVAPALLILDEPLGPLEPRAREEFREEVRRLHDRIRTTTLVLTREPREALAQADRLAIMDQGRVVQDGTPAEVYNRPADAFVAQLFGKTNLLPGQVEGMDPRGEVLVRTPLGRLLGRAPAGPPGGGAAVTVAIRPEAVGLGPGVPPGANRFAATLERLVFLGALREVHLRGPGDWPVIALALQAPSQLLRAGQGLMASVLPDQVIVLPGQYARPR